MFAILFTVLFVATVTIAADRVVVLARKRAHAYRWDTVCTLAAFDEWGTMTDSKNYSQYEMDHSEYLRFYRNHEGLLVKTFWL